MLFYRKDFLELFKLKHLLCFSLSKNDSNAEVIQEIILKLLPFEINSTHSHMLYNREGLINSITTEKQEKKSK
jgi:hypothetical protein